MNNVYLNQVYAALPRVLSSFDTNPISLTYGVGDRYRWAWKLTDFGNAKFQGLANGLARLVACELLPSHVSARSILDRIDGIFEGLERLRYANGSVAEAFPHENSIALTGFVANDMLTAVSLLKKHITPQKREKYLSVVEPLIEFLKSADETHGLISNHLAGVAAALVKWVQLTGESDHGKARKLLRRVLRAQSGEGWFLEYQGPDPGYQTFCTNYLADIHRDAPELELGSAIHRSIVFLWNFAHPDGSFGGLYGSRNTRFYAPAGIEALAPEFPEAAELACFMRKSIAEEKVVTLSGMDAHNLAPMFNNYCWAAAELETRGLDTHTAKGDVPAVSSESWRRTFKEAGILIDKGKRHYTIISWNKGGVCYHFKDGEASIIDAGVVLSGGKRSLYSTQGYSQTNDYILQNDVLTINARFSEVKQPLPTPIQFIMLRLLSISLMRLRVFGELVKRALVRLLITENRLINVTNTRVIKLGYELSIYDNWSTQRGRFVRVPLSRPFSIIHMASQGYWQVQDDKD